MSDKRRMLVKEYLPEGTVRCGDDPDKGENALHVSAAKPLTDKRPCFRAGAVTRVRDCNMAYS
jgi:hypothetical protein